MIVTVGQIYMHMTCGGEIAYTVNISACQCLRAVNKRLRIHR